MKSVGRIIYDGIDTHIRNKVINTRDFRIWKRENPVLAMCVEYNRRFKNIHKGERCFILANGPSLKNDDLSKIDGEIIFGMNLCAKELRMRGVKLKYYMALDGIFFRDNSFYQNREDMIDNLKELVEMKGVDCFFPIEVRDFIRGHRFDKQLSANYCGPVRLSMNGLNPEEINTCDMSRFRYMSYSISIDAVMAAIYMGFSEIYLLGCDASVIKSRVDILMGGSAYNTHFYENKGDDKGLESRIKKKGIISELSTEFYSFQNWNYIRLYCAKHAIKIINLSSSTLLDFIPRKNYSLFCKESLGS